MKSAKITALVLLISIMLTSCNVNITLPGIESGTAANPPITDNENNINTGNTDQEQRPADYNNEDITFDIGEQVMIVASADMIENTFNIQQMISRVTDSDAIAITDDMNEFANEFVIGRCNRQISRDAYSRLESESRDGIYTARVGIYSTGNSVALVFDDVFGYSDYVFNYAVNLFKTKYIIKDSPIHIPEGHFYTETVDLIAYQEALDAETEAEAWKNFEAAAGTEAAAALKTMYETIYSGSLVAWLAGIYDTELGGFYFANSTRDNEKTFIDGAYYDLLPDIESTDQALEFIRMSGMLGGGTLKDSLPKWMVEKLVKFVKEKQDENGYFYHPQWTHAMVDAELSRRGRDLSKAISTLTALGAKPTYNTPTGVEGDGLKWDGTPISKTALTMPIKHSAPSAVSLVVKTAVTYPSHMENKAAFEAYLESLNGKMASDPYWVGNQLASQADQIKARDAELKSAGESYSLASILGKWLDSKCYSTTGHWSPTADYPGLNGFLKISATYQSLGLELPYPEAAARSAVDSIELSGRYPTACFAYNSWMSVSIIINNVNKHKSASDAARIVNNIRSELHERAHELIEVTMRKQGTFLVEDGSFMYIESGSSGKSQNLPISIPDTIEGTMNSTLLCTTGTVSHMMAAFGYPTVPLLYRSDLNEFITLIEAQKAANN